MKSRPLSIFLLKNNFNAQNALKDDNSLEEVKDVQLPANAKLFLANTPLNEPWWKSYLGLQMDLLQGLKGAILFLPVASRTFVFTFGNVYHNLKDESYEYDFGLLTTLNSIDPNALKSTDVLRPENALRQRIQTPQSSDLTFFDFDRDSSVIKRLTGKVKAEYKALFTNTTGANNLRITTRKNLSDLPALCSELLEIYEKEDYKTLFPDLHNIRPVKDPSRVSLLNEALICELRRRSQDVLLTIPDITDYNNIYAIKFSENRNSNSYDDIGITAFYAEVGDNLHSLTVEMLRSKYPVTVYDENNHPLFHNSLYKSLIWDYANEHGETFHLCDGNWYQVEQQYLTNLTRAIDIAFTDYELPAFTQRTEGEYNANIPSLDRSFICLDEKNIAPVGESSVEPCDLYKVENGIAHYIHVKKGTRSSLLSHLFNQGVNSIVLIHSDEGSKEKMKELVRSSIASNSLSDYWAPVENKRAKVIFAIISPKESALKSKILPLFSRISLKRAIQSLKSMNVDFAVTIIKDASKNDHR